MTEDEALACELADARLWRARLEADVSRRPRLEGRSSGELEALVRRQYHREVRADLAWRRARLAVDLLVGGRELDEVLERTGLRTPATLDRATQEIVGMPSDELAKLGRATSFELRLPNGYRLASAFGNFARDPGGRLEQLDGRSARKSLRLGGAPAILEFERRGRDLRVRVRGMARPGRRRMLEAVWSTARLLGLAPSPRPFERRAAGDSVIARLVEGSRGLRIQQTADAFEGLVWVIVGQQVNVSFAAICRARLAELAGTPVGDMVAHPSADEVARLDVADLLPLQFSRRKAEYVIDTARLIASGELDLERLRTEPAQEIERTLLAVRGLGRWSVNYLMMRSFGLADCVPAGDSALGSALTNFFGLSARPDADETVRQMEVFAPHRSLATIHLWRSYS